MDAFLEAVDDDPGNSASLLYGCKLRKKYIGPDSRTVNSPKLRMRHCEVAERNGGQQELVFVSCLRKSITVPILLIEIRCGKSSTRKAVNESSEYIFSPFILGSSSEVERMFSIDKHLLPPCLRAITLHLFEDLLFLRFNVQFWDPHLIRESIKN